MTDEEWRPVPGFERFYSVSNLGRIRRDEQIVRPTPKRNGYLGYTISKPSRRSSHWVHWLVATVFLGPRPTGHHIHHKNGDHTDNAADNLQYMPAEEHLGLPKLGTRGSRNGRARLTEEHVRAIRVIPRSEVNWDALAAQYGVSRHAIRAVRTGESWGHVESMPKTPVAKLAAADVRAIRSAPGGFGRIAALATQYGVSPVTIWRIRAGRSRANEHHHS